MIETEIFELCNQIDTASFNEHDALEKKVIALSKRAGRGLQVGKLIRFGVADGYALYFVTKVGPKTVEVRHVALYDAYAFQGIILRNGKGKVSRTIAERACGFDDLLGKMKNDSDGFYDSLTSGSIVHYHNGFGQYVRCEVTEDHQLKSIALVGNWGKNDLPYRYPNGEICLPYHVKKIMSGEGWRTPADNIFEYSKFSRTGNATVDPRQLSPIDLTVPPMTAEEHVRAAKIKRLDAIRELAGMRDDLDTTFEAIRNLCQPD
jgi:hypothetical protein